MVLHVFLEFASSLGDHLGVVFIFGSVLEEFLVFGVVIPACDLSFLLFLRLSGASLGPDRVGSCGILHLCRSAILPFVSFGDLGLHESKSCRPDPIPRL